MSDGLVVIIMGSGSDYEERGSKIENECKELGLDTEVRVFSAHRTPGPLLDALKEYDKMDRDIVYITVAGMSDGLSGMVAGASTRPSIACPPLSRTGDNHEDYRSSYNMPPGIAHAFIPTPKNAAIYAAKILGVKYEAFKLKVGNVLQEGVTKVNQADLKYKR
jgi:phosphoribosylaminoimidazole carboxylase PurE protein